MDMATSRMLERIIQQNEELANRQKELIRLGRLELPITQLPICQSEKDFLYQRGAHKISDVLVPDFFDLQDAKEHSSTIAFFESWGFKIKIPDDMKIENIDLPVRVQNALKAHGIIFLSELLQTPPGVLIKTRELGKKSIEDIRTALNLLGYDW